MRRLFEDPAMPSALRDDLTRSRVAGQAYDVASKLPQLQAALSDASRQPLEADLSPAAGAAEATLGVPAAWKLVLLAAVGGGAVLVALPFVRPEPPAKPPAAQPAVAAPALPAAPVVEAAPAPAQVAPVVESEPPQATPAPPSAARSSRREIAQLVRIRQLMERNPKAAYALALRSQAEFPQGVLSEEREALLVIALAKSGATSEAAREARAFFARHPQSPMRELIEAALR